MKLKIDQLKIEKIEGKKRLKKKEKESASVVHIF